MTDQTRLKNAKGQWLDTDPKTAATGGAPWLSASFLNSLREASALPKAGPELKELVATASQLPLVDGPAFKEPHTEASEALYAAWSAERRAREEQDWQRHYPHRAKSVIEPRISHMLLVGKTQFQPTTPMSWLLAPAPYSLAWTADPGKAALFEGAGAMELKARCERLVAISKLLPKALKNAQALGVAIDPRALPETHKVLPGVALAADGEAEAFNPASEYLTRECYALYVERGQVKGFVTHKPDVVKPDLGSARLFPTIAEAERSGKGYYRNYALVTVDIAPKSFERRGSPGDLTDLAAAICAKEALEIELALKTADIDRLRQEIQSRESAPAPAPAAAPSRSRL